MNAEDAGAAALEQVRVCPRVRSMIMPAREKHFESPPHVGRSRARAGLRRAQFCLLAKNMKGRAVVGIIQQAISSKGVRSPAPRLRRARIHPQE